MNFKKTILKNKNFKLGYYIGNTIHNILPSSVLQSGAKKWSKKISKSHLIHIQKRVDYYIKLSEKTAISNQKDVLTFHTFTKPEHSKIYYYDLKKYLKYFDPDAPFLYAPGDNIKQFDLPHLVKSRPISNSRMEVILKLNEIRHFNFIKDDVAFDRKENLLFGRLAVYQDNRKKFFERYYQHPMCDIGDVATHTNSPWLKPKVSINEHLSYKFLLALEGNDVATNLKWIMSSNSIAVMPKPRYETWFMEGLLRPDYHYICIKDDYSDLEEKLNYYIARPDEAKTIVRNANRWIKQFLDLRREHIINLAVMYKYFQLTY